MGAYITITSVLTMMPQLPQATASSGWTGTTNLISNTVSFAEDKVNSYLAVKYTLPFTTVPPLVRSEALKLAVYYTYKYQYSSDNQNANAFVEIEDGSSNSVFKNLEEIRDGKLRLTDTSGSLVAFKASGRGFRSNRGEFTPVFDMDSVTSSQVDESLLDTITSSRD